MNVLVTGGLGFIGKHLVRELEGLGHLPIPADRKHPSRFDLSDLVDAETVLKLSGASCIVHLAATCSTPGSIENPMVTFRDTVQTAVNVLEVARREGVRVILVSSVKARDGMTPYGAAKRMAEMWAWEYHRTYGLPVTVVRPGTVYGPGQEGSPESGWIAWFLKAKRENLTVVINGDGSQTRDLLHVDDLVRLLVRMVIGPADYSGHTWDVGGGVQNAVTVQQMADFLGLEYTFGPPRPGDVDSYIGKNDVPDWEPRIEWRDAIRRLW